MSFVLLDDKFHSHPKRTEVGLSGAGLFACALSYCGDHLTDGFVPGGWAHEIASRPLCKRLVVAGFWIEVAPGDGPYLYVSGDESYSVEIVKAGYFIPDYLVLNPNREAVLLKRSELSAKRSEAGKKGAAAKWRRVRINKEMREAVARALGVGPGETALRSCTYCGVEIIVDWSKESVRFLDSSGASTPEIDHATALASGGPHSVENLRLACLSCNKSKGTLTLTEWQASGKAPGKALASAWETDGPLSPSPKEITKAVDLPRHDGERPHLHIQNPEAA